MNCLIRFWRLCFLSERKRNYDINNKDFESLIDKIKAKTYKFKTVLPPQKIPKKVLVLDLDETLVSSTFNKPPRFDFEA
jgi:TFIIF-interacting CTD phosphatase-like protein